MGRRNLALVGTHQDYYADMFDDLTGENPSIVTGCASPEDAATTYFRNVFENSGGMVRRAVVAVWPAVGNQVMRRVYEMNARLMPCGAVDAGPDEFEVTISARETPNGENSED